MNAPDKAAAVGELAAAYENDTKAWMGGLSFGTSAPGLYRETVSKKEHLGSAGRIGSMWNNTRST